MLPMNRLRTDNLNITKGEPIPTMMIILDHHTLTLGLPSRPGCRPWRVPGMAGSMSKSTFFAVLDVGNISREECQSPSNLKSVSCRTLVDCYSILELDLGCYLSYD